MKRENQSGHSQISSVGVEEANRVLKKLASQFPKNSKEYKAVELAARALLYVFQSGGAAEFRLFIQKFDSELTDEQKKHLLDMGIEP